jgi:hypothetical protein
MDIYFGLIAIPIGCIGSLKKKEQIASWQNE